MKEIPDKYLNDLQNVISRMPLELFCSIALSELGLDWKDVVNYISINRLPLNPRSVARIVRQYAVDNIDGDTIKDIIAVLKLKVAVKSTPQWHTINMDDKIFPEENFASTVKMLPTRVLHAARRIVRMPHAEAQVHSTRIGDYFYISLQMVSPTKTSTLYVAFVVHQPIAFVNTMANKKLMQAVVEGIGYKTFTNAELCGPDITSLYRIIDRSINTNINTLTDLPETKYAPVLTKNGIDCTNRILSNKMDRLLGPNPPLLNQLEVTCNKWFIHDSVLNKSMKISLQLKSENVAETLKSWVVDKVIGPESELLKVFHLTKSNKYVYEYDGDDSEMN